ncbi:MAG TPA: LytTR family DNA-binding domain-containing protein [Opitutaceae bacterium]|jgi:two-component system LytT family response regulator|nr:LytTR family DNA-binding domain-containing protein [Opitutaceae bacterium]
MANLRVLIADDEPLARERLRRLLGGEPGVEIVAEAGDGPAAQAAIAEHRPDLVFLDVQMPGRDGLQVLAGLPPESRPAVIFVTAHERFALEAFNVRAVDYLLKPFDRDRFRIALARAAEHRRSRGEGRPPERLAVRADGRVVFVRPSEIRWIEAADNYIILHLADQRLMARETLSAFELQLGSVNFARVNRSALVQLDQVKELQPGSQGGHVVVLRDGTRLPLSRALRDQFVRFVSGNPPP